MGNLNSSAQLQRVSPVPKKTIERQDSPASFVIVPKNNANVVVLVSPRSDSPQKEKAVEKKAATTVIPFVADGFDADDGSLAKPKMKTLPSQRQIPAEQSLASADVESIHMGQSEKNYWKDLNASLRRSSWKEFELSTIIGKRLSGGTHTVTTKKQPSSANLASNQQQRGSSSSNLNKAVASSAAPRKNSRTNNS
eukprot:gene10047-11118_t